MRIDQISKYINNQPSIIQIAKDDKWEDVWIIDVKSVPTSEDVQKYLQSSTYKYVSIEIVFKQSDGVYIFGMDYNNHLLAKKTFDFLMTSIDITTTYTDFVSFIHKLNSKLLGQSYLFQDEPDAIRIGVVNHWLSVGLCVAWQKGWSKKIPRDELWKKLSANTDLYKTKLNYQGMSFAVNLKGLSPGICHWMKSPCSTQEGEYWVLSEQKVAHYLKDWADITLA